MKPFRAVSVPEPLEWDFSPWEFFQKNELPEEGDEEAKEEWENEVGAFFPLVVLDVFGC